MTTVLKETRCVQLESDKKAPVQNTAVEANGVVATRKIYIVPVIDARAIFYTRATPGTEMLGNEDEFDATAHMAYWESDYATT